MADLLAGKSKIPGTEMIRAVEKTGILKGKIFNATSSINYFWNAKILSKKI